MSRFVVRRLLQAFLTILLAVGVVFLLVRLTGDPVTILLPPEAGAEEAAALRQRLGLDQPLPIQFAIYLRDLITGDLGVSLVTRRPVTDLIIERIPPSIQLAVVSMALALLIAIPTGVISATRRGERTDRLTQGVAFVGVSAPSFWLSILSVQVFAVVLGVLPVAGIGEGRYLADIQHLILPCLVIALHQAAVLMRLTRSSMIEALDSDYVKLGRIEGLPQYKITWVHALRNALIPMFTYSAVILANLIAGSVAVEVVFNWPGVGRLAYQGLLQRDFPVVQGTVLFAVLVVVVINFIVDVTYARIDPRVRVE